jgi:hypothetical protein
MFKLIAIIMMFVALYFLTTGAYIAYQKVAMDSSDALLIGLTLMVLAVFADRLGGIHGTNSN